MKINRFLVMAFAWAVVLAIAASAHAQTNLDARILNNIYLGPDPVILPSNQRAQAEPHLARSFSDPTLLIATWQSGRYTSIGGSIGNEYAVSRDGGLTWTRNFVPSLTQMIDGGPFQRTTDPVGAISFDNVMFQNCLNFDASVTDPPSQITVSKMNAGEVGLGAPITAYQDQWPANYADKNWIAINTFPGSPWYGRIIVAGNLFLLDPNNNYSVTNVTTLVVWSDDEGQTWSAPSVLPQDRTYFLQPVWLPNGNLAIGFYWSRPGAGSVRNFAVVISEDGGQTFSAPITVAANVSLNDVPNIDDSGYLCSLTSDRLRGVLYMNWSASSSLIQFSRSIDGGSTWSTPVNVRDTNTGAAFHPAIGASPDGQHISILFYDSRGMSTLLSNNVYLAESFDGGETWEPNVQVSEKPSDFSNGPLTPNGYFYGDYHAITPALDFDTPGVAIWIDGRNGNPDPYVAQIARTQGTTFEAWRRLRFTTAQLADPAISGEAGDPENDHIPNCIEYICGFEPDEMDASPFKVSSFTGPNSITLTYTALPVVTDKEIFWEKSTDLTSWQEVIPVSMQSERATEAAFQRYTVQFTGEDILFLRMGARAVVE